MIPIAYRRATIADAELASDLRTAAFPQLPEDPVMTRYRWLNPRQGWTYGQFVAEAEGRPVAYLEMVHAPWDQLPDRNADVEASHDPALVSAKRLPELWAWIGDHAAADGARVLTAYAGAEDVPVIDALVGLGYELDREERVWRLDLVEHGPRLSREADTAQSKMAAAGIRLTTMEAWDDKDGFAKLHALNEVTLQDVPHSTPILPQPLDHFVKAMHAPDRPHDRLWIAVDDDRPIAFSFLRYPPVRGHVWTGYTACDRGYRGRGIARATKLQTLKQAIGLGIPTVGTDNDSENAPMLHINQKLGYEAAPGWRQYQKRL